MDKTEETKETEQLEKSLAQYNEMLQQNPNDAALFCEKGKILLNLQRNKDAYIAFEQATKLQPDLALAHSGRGIASQKAEQYESALLAFGQAIRSDPTYVQAYKNKGNLLIRLKRYKEAIPVLDKLLELDPTNEQVAKTLANLKRYKSRQARRKINGCYMELWRIYYAIIISGTGLVIAAFSFQISPLLALFMLLLTIGAVLILFIKTFR